MPKFIIKPDANIDFYVDWSTIVDAPINAGTAKELNLDPARKERADRTGTSAFDQSEGGWDDKGFIVTNMGTDSSFYWLDRKNLLVFMQNLGDHSDAAEQKALDVYCTVINHDDD